MLKLDNNLLDELGLSSLPDDQKRAMLQHIYETLELRVGTNLANQMSDQQLEEFEKFIDDGGDANQAQALQWLESNLPNYKQVVNEVFVALKGEISQMAPQLVAASVQQPQMPPANQAAMPQAPPAYQPQLQYSQPPTPPQPVSAPYQGSQAPQAAPVQATEYYQTPQGMQQPGMPQAPQQLNPKPYQLPQEQPPAGPGSQQSPQTPPQYPGQQAP